MFGLAPAAGIDMAQMQALLMQQGMMPQVQAAPQFQTMPQMQQTMQLGAGGMPGACGGMPGAGGKGGGKTGGKKHVPCIHFARGFCARGTECWYNHDPTAGPMVTGDWDCPACGDKQFARNEACRQCGTPRPAEYGPMMTKGAGKGKGGPYMMGGPMFVPKMDNTVPASPQEVEAFLMTTPVEEHAQTQFRQMDPRAQRMVINRGQMENAQDLTAAFIGRMKSVNRIVTQGVSLAPGDWLCPGCLDTQFARNASCRRCGITKENGAESIQTAAGMDMTAAVMSGAMGTSAMPNLENVIPATPQEVEEFLILNPVEEHAQLQFRQMDPKGQRMVINRGKMEGARDPTAAFMGRLKSVKKTITGQVQLAPGDWICSGCGDLQFGRNKECRRCGIEKPPSAAVPGPITSCKFCQAGHCWNHGPAAQVAAAQMQGMPGMSMQGMPRMQAAHPNLDSGPLAHTLPADPVEVEQFLLLNPVEAHAQQKFRNLHPKIQRLVINKGTLEGARDSTAAFIGRMVSVEKIANGLVQIPPGDWICYNCGDHQYSRNESCRKCGSGKPPDAGEQPQMAATAATAMAGMDIGQLMALQMAQAQMAQAQAQLQAPGMAQMQGMMAAAGGDWACTSCGTAQPAGSMFCGQCGAQRVA